MVFDVDIFELKKVFDVGLLALKNWIEVGILGHSRIGQLFFNLFGNVDDYDKNCFRGWHGGWGVGMGGGGLQCTYRWATHGGYGCCILSCKHTCLSLM